MSLKILLSILAMIATVREVKSSTMANIYKFILSQQNEKTIFYFNLNLLFP